MEDWCPPSFAERTKPLQARFGPGLGQDKRTIEVGKIARSLPVAAADDSDDVRAAKFRLLEGKFLFAEGGLEDAVLCLCSEGAQIPGDLREKCDSAWRNKHANKALCEKGSDRGTMPFDGSSGAIEFPANEQKARALVQVE